MTPTLEQIASQTAEKIVSLTGFGHALHVNDILPDIREALQTATKQPEEADWAEAAAKELASDLFSNCYGGHVSNYESEKAVFTQEVAAIIRKHAPPRGEPGGLGARQ